MQSSSRATRSAKKRPRIQRTLLRSSLKNFQRAGAREDGPRQQSRFTGVNFDDKGSNSSVSFKAPYLMRVSDSFDVIEKFDGKDDNTNMQPAHA